MTNKSWFISPFPKADPKLRLFCFPYAGGGISTYTNWSARLPEYVELICVQPPGRGARLMESAYSNMENLVNAFLAHFPSPLNSPFVFFGHSLGGLVAFEVSCRLVKKGLKAPLHLISSGSRAPHMPYDIKNWHELPNDDFTRILFELNGTPEELLENSEIMDLYRPLLKADFQVADQYRSKKFTLPCAITTLCGTEDHIVTPLELEGWRELSSESFELILVDGDHFFVVSNYTAVLKIINGIIENLAIVNR